MRLLYQATGMNGLCPQDASLNLPAESFSLGVRRRVAEEAASGSFDHAVERVAATTGAHVAKRQAEELVRRAAVDFESFYADPVIDVADEAELLMVLSFDAAGIVMLMLATLMTEYSYPNRRHGALFYQVMAAVLPFTASRFARALVMPNLKPPMTTTQGLSDYRARILARRRARRAYRAKQMAKATERRRILGRLRPGGNP